MTASPAEFLPRSVEFSDLRTGEVVAELRESEDGELCLSWDSSGVFKLSFSDHDKET